MVMDRLRDDLSELVPVPLPQPVHRHFDGAMAHAELSCQVGVTDVFAETELRFEFVEQFAFATSRVFLFEQMHRLVQHRQGPLPIKQFFGRQIVAQLGLKFAVCRGEIKV